MLHSHSRSFLKLPSRGKGVFNTGAHLVECVGSKMKKIKKNKNKKKKRSQHKGSPTSTNLCSELIKQLY